FLGLIGASAVVLYGEVAVDSLGRVSAAVVGFVLAVVVTGVSGNGELGHSLPVVFAAGAVASAAMLLPGISGAAFLYILGQYTFLTGRLERFVDAVLALPGAPATLGTDAAVVAVFLAGVGTGLLTVARAVRWALHRSRPATMTFLISLMAGSLRLPVERVLAAPGGVSPAAVAATGAGIAVVVAVDRATTGATP
ncbi:MAG: DUF368 domain-containing protein, partial [Candidatus Nanohaloarchaea archaeon]|nr:DUF368 domain-containing protein [Candidatus Nanohaloarchaea archaeon]